MRWSINTHTHTLFILKHFSLKLQNSISTAASSRTPGPLVNKGHRFDSQTKGKTKDFCWAQPFAESDGSWKRDRAEAWKRLQLYNHLTWKTDLEQMQNTNRDRQKRGKRTQGASRGLWWAELMEFKSKSLISPQCSSAPSQERWSKS